MPRSEAYATLSFLVWSPFAAYVIFRLPDGHLWHGLVPPPFVKQRPNLHQPPCLRIPYFLADTLLSLLP